MSESKAQTQTTDSAIVTEEGAKMLKCWNRLGIFWAFLLVTNFFLAQFVLQLAGVSRPLLFVIGLAILFLLGGSYVLLSDLLKSLIEKVYAVNPPVRSYGWASRD